MAEIQIPIELARELVKASATMYRSLHRSAMTYPQSGPYIDQSDDSVCRTAADLMAAGEVMSEAIAAIEEELEGNARKEVQAASSTDRD